MTRCTPRMPDWIRNFRHPKYCNIYEICPDESFLFGTESLYGDWDAELLILAQDAGPAVAFERLRAAKHPRPFAHREFRPGFPHYDPQAGRGGAGTNQVVYELAERVACSKLYGSALAGLCKLGEDYSSKLPSLGEVRPHCVRVLRWVVDPVQMPRLRAIVSLGNTARDIASRALREAPSLPKAPRLFSTPHPAAHAAIGKVHAVMPIWQAMATQMGWRFR
jgi:hypothetical protein